MEETICYEIPTQWLQSIPLKCIQCGDIRCNNFRRATSLLLNALPRRINGLHNLSNPARQSWSWNKQWHLLMNIYCPTQKNIFQTSWPVPKRAPKNFLSSLKECGSIFRILHDLRANWHQLIINGTHRVIPVHLLRPYKFYKSMVSNVVLLFLPRLRKCSSKTLRSLTRTNGHLKSISTSDILSAIEQRDYSSHKYAGPTTKISWISI